MARIAGVNIPNHQHTVIGLTAIYGIGRPRAQQICSLTGVPTNKKVNDLDDNELEKLRDEIGKFIAEGATNVIPNEVKIEGTFRAMDEEWRADGLAKMKKLAEGIAESMGGSCEFFVLKGYPFLKNNPELTRRMKEAAIEYMGAENVIDLDIWMAAEDFAFYTHHVDACFYRLGTRNDEKGIINGVHTPNFNIDEKALNVGPGLMAWLAIQELNLA